MKRLIGFINSHRKAIGWGIIGFWVLVVLWILCLMYGALSILIPVFVCGSIVVAVWLIMTS